MLFYKLFERLVSGFGFGLGMSLSFKISQWANDQSKLNNNFNFLK